ncbi:MAG: 50S ribosomal protein L6 [Phycisphaerae bacterium]
MSRIGKQPIPLPAGVKVDVAGQTVNVQGPKGKLSWSLPAGVRAAVADGRVSLTRGDDAAQSRALHGLSRALIQNMVIGVVSGYQEKLEVHGTGYNCKLQGKQLLLNIGFMGRGVGRPAQFMIDIPEGIQVDIEVPAARGENEPAKFTVKGIDKQLVGQFAAELRKLRKPEPYKGKGIRYAAERVKRKAGKVFAGGGAG